MTLYSSIRLASLSFIAALFAYFFNILLFSKIIRFFSHQLEELSSTYLRFFLGIFINEGFDLFGIAIAALLILSRFRDYRPLVRAFSIVSLTLSIKFIVYWITQTINSESLSLIFAIFIIVGGLETFIIAKLLTKFEAAR